MYVYLLEWVLDYTKFDSRARFGRQHTACRSFPFHKTVVVCENKITLEESQFHSSVFVFTLCTLLRCADISRVLTTHSSRCSSFRIRRLSARKPFPYALVMYCFENAFFLRKADNNNKYTPCAFINIDMQARKRNKNAVNFQRNTRTTGIRAPPRYDSNNSFNLAAVIYSYFG